MIDVQHDALRALEKNALVCADLLVEHLPDRLGVSKDFRGDLEKVGFKRFTIGLGQADTCAKGAVMSVGRKAVAPPARTVSATTSRASKPLRSGST